MALAARSARRCATLKDAMSIHAFTVSRMVPTVSLLVMSHFIAAEDREPSSPPSQPSTPASSPPAGESAVPVPTESETITVVGALNSSRNQIQPSLGATTYQIGLKQIQAASQGDDAPFSQLLLRLPGIAQDQYGQVHLRGEHANIQFRINGVLLPEGLITFGQEIDTHFADSMTLITGSLPAQYGLRTAGIVDITTKTGAIDPGGDVDVYGGSYRTLRTSATYGQTIGKWDTYGSVSEYHSDLGIDNPTPDKTALHDTTNQYRGFVYASYLIDPSSRVSLIASASQDRFEIPNTPNQSALFTVSGAPPPDSSRLDERQLQRNSYAVLAYQKDIGQASIQLAPFIRESQFVFDPDFTGDLAFNGVASSIDRTALTSGFQLDASLPVGPAHTLRAGTSYSGTQALIQTATAVFPVDANGNQTSTDPQTIIDNHSKLGSFYSLYLQDEWRISAYWTINYGLRADVVQAYVNQQQISPRINTTYQLTASTSVHAGYSRYFTPPPLEAVSQETENKFNETSNASATSDNSNIKSERGNYFDAGISQRLGKHAQIGLDGYYKRATDQLDEGQFGTALILSPFNYRQGRIMGTELTATYENNQWTGYVNMALSKAEGKDINTAQFLFGSDELTYSQNHYIYLDHDQRWTASAGLSYDFVTHTKVSVDGLYGTGLREGFANTGKVPNYGTVNASVVQSIHHLEIRFDVVNLFDRVYQIRDGSGIGVSAPSYGQRRSFYGGIKYTF
jgi:hypothetical protein